MTRNPGFIGARIAALAISLAAVAALAAVPAAAAQRHEDLERFALKLVNCTRTGGWVKSDGKCKDFGSGEHSAYRPPLEFHGGVADEVAWPWARKIAKSGYCGHTAAGSSVEERFRQAGYKNPDNGESVGCSYAWRPREMILRTHLMMQREKSFKGSHWRQMKDPGFRSAGIGVAKAGTKTRLVIDFYGQKERSE